MNSNSRSRFRTAPNIIYRRQSNNPIVLPGTEGQDQELKNFDPTDCVGVWLGKKKMGSEHCWEATGAVREIFKSLSKEILDQLGGPSEPGDPIVAWSIYMIGKTKATAVPTLLFICSQRAARRFIKVQIEESGILDKYPTIRVGDCSKPPDFGKATSLENLQDGKGDQIKMLAGSEGDQGKSLLGNEDTHLDVFIHPTHRLLGCRLFAASMRAATAGASFQMHGRYFITTVNHVFRPQDKPPSTDLDDDESESEFEFEIRGVEPDTEADGSNIDIEDSGLNDSPLSLHFSSRDQPFSTGELIKLGEVIFSATDAGNPGSDFSLVEIDEKYTRRSGAMIFAGLPSYTDLKCQIATEPADIYVKVVTASNFLEGRMTGTPTFIRCPGGLGFQEVWTVRFNGQLNQGDCGSLVTGLNCATIYGHIIAGSPESNVAYIVPAAQMFDGLDDYFAQRNPAHHVPTSPQEANMSDEGSWPEEVENRLPTSSYERKVRQIGLWPQHPAKCPTGRPYKRKIPISGRNLTRKRANSLLKQCNKERPTGQGYPPALSTPNNVQNKSMWIEEKTRFKEASSSPFPAIFQDTSSPFEIEILGNFLRGTSFKDVEAGKGEPGTLRAAWFDDRSNPNFEGSEGARFDINPLTATGLLHALKAPRFNDEKKPDAQPDVTRRLIYINDLSPGFVHALAAAAPLGEAKALRSAICTHIAFQASIMVKTRSDGLALFQWEFHLPYFVIRKCPLDQSGDEEKFLGKANAKSGRRSRWSDASFLRLESIDSAEPDEQRSNETWGLYECHISVLITGRDNWQWTAYSFADTDSDRERYEYTDGFDPNLELDASKPIWEPREYFLKALQINLREVREEWEYLIFKLECSIEDHMENKVAFSHRDVSPREPAESLKERFIWCLQNVRLLSKLTHVLSGLVHQCNTFTTGGDIEHFYNTGTRAVSPDVYRRLIDIKKTMQKFETLQRRISSLKDRCRRDQKTLELLLSLEGNDASKETSISASLFIWVLYPITLSASIFSMLPTVIPFSTTPVWFFLSVFLLIGMMFVVHFIMRNHRRFRRNIAFWVKTCMREDRLGPEERLVGGGYSQIPTDEAEPKDIEAFGNGIF